MKSSSPSSNHTLSRLTLLSVVALLLSGCTMRALVGVEVEADGSGVFEVTVAYDEELRSFIEQESEEPIDWSDPSSLEDEESFGDIVEDLPDSAEVEPYSEDDFEGFTMSVEFGSLEELDEILSEASEDEAFPIEITEPEEGRFVLSTEGDIFGDEGLEGEDTEMFPPSMLEDLFDMQLRVSLPGEIVETNAPETTDDGVMVWDLNPMAEEQTQPEAISEVSSSSNLLFIVLGVLVIGAVVAGILYLRRGTTATETVPPEPEGTPAS